MKILHTVESYHPALGGMQEVVKQLSERLVKLGHQVTVATSDHFLRKETFINGVQIQSFHIKGNFVRGLEGQVNDYQKFLLHSEFDIITNFAAQQWATDIALPILSKIKSKKVFVPTGFSGLYLPEYKKYFEDLKGWMKHYDMNVFLSNDYRDINFAKTNGIKKYILIPNGAGENEFLIHSDSNIRKKLGIADNAFLILHVGSYTGIKGHKEACQIFLRSKIDNAVLLLIGNNNEVFKKRFWRNVKIPLLFKKINKKNKKIIITSTLSREETIAAYQSADLFLFPSNIECSPIVLFECMASKTPFLTTDVGNSKEIIAWSNAGLLMPTTIDKKGYSHAIINDSIQLLDELYINNSKRKELYNSGYNAWNKNFTWEIITEKYLEMYKNLLKSV